MKMGIDREGGRREEGEIIEKELFKDERVSWGKDREGYVFTCRC